MKRSDFAGPAYSVRAMSDACSADSGALRCYRSARGWLRVVESSCCSNFEPELQRLPYRDVLGGNQNDEGVSETSAMLSQSAGGRARTVRALSDVVNRANFQKCCVFPVRRSVHCERRLLP